jgi:hypothetical protein
MGIDIGDWILRGGRSHFFRQGPLSQRSVIECVVIEEVASS